MVGAAADAHRLPKLDQAVKEGDAVAFGSASARVIDTPGHTRGQINYFIADGEILLSGDTLFSLGCGRLIEGTAAEMFASLRKLAALPPARWCAAAMNTPRATPASRSASIRTMPPEGAHRAGHQQRAAGQPTVPRRWRASSTPIRSCARRTSRRSPICGRRKTNSDVKLCFSPTSPYVRKVRACAITRGDRQPDRTGADRCQRIAAGIRRDQSAVKDPGAGDRRWRGAVRQSGDLRVPGQYRRCAADVSRSMVRRAGGRSSSRRWATASSMRLCRAAGK